SGGGRGAGRGVPMKRWAAEEGGAGFAGGGRGGARTWPAFGAGLRGAAFFGAGFFTGAAAFFAGGAGFFAGAAFAFGGAGAGSSFLKGNPLCRGPDLIHQRASDSFASGRPFTSMRTMAPGRISSFPASAGESLASAATSRPI